MIPAEMVVPALRALQQLIIQAKTKAYLNAGEELAQYLNDFELIPECITDEADRTEELIATFHGMAETYPGCRQIVDDFDRAASQPTQVGK